MGGSQTKFLSTCECVKGKHAFRSQSWAHQQNVSVAVRIITDSAVSSSSSVNFEPYTHCRPLWLVLQRGPSQLAVEDRGSAAAAAAAAAVRGADATETATMSSYDHINDEEELHKLVRENLSLAG